MGHELTAEQAPEQFILEGFEPSKTRRAATGSRSKLFFAMKPPWAIAERIFTDAADHATGRTRRKAYPAELLHITLVAIGGFQAIPHGLINRLQTAMEDVKARPISVTLDRSALFGNRNSLALHNVGGLPAISSLAAMIRRTLRRRNLPCAPQQSLTPHVTTVYGCGKIDLMPIRNPYCWLAGDFELIFSHYGETRHESFGRWALLPDADDYPQTAAQLDLYAPEAA
ncbi:2'-5' RNA ligase [Rhizobium sp. AN70]|nr:2'-5' RNA ligase [Rhizobium sp. AN70]